MSADVNPLSVPAHRHVNHDGTVGGWVADSAYVGSGARIEFGARIGSGAHIGSYARILTRRHVMIVGPVGSEDQCVTLYRTETGHTINVGCWTGHQVDELAAEVARRAPGHADEYADIEPLCRRRIAEWDAERAAVDA